MAIAYRTCPLCEATCGLEIEVDDAGKVGKIRGDDAGRLQPRLPVPEGRRPARAARGSRPGAHPTAARRERRVRADLLGRGVRRDRPAADADRRRSTAPTPSAAYLGNPTAHNLGALLYGRVLLKAIGTREHLLGQHRRPVPQADGVSALMFGSGASVPVPDLDRTDYLLMLGANPLASNGSLMTAPDARGRLRAIRARGGKFVVVDPRRTRTAMEADEHLFLRPGTDALLLFALAHVIFEEGLEELGRREGIADGLDVVRALAADFPPEGSPTATGVDARDDPPHRPRARGRAERRRLRADRDYDAGVRHDRELAGRRPQRDHGQPRPARAARCGRLPAAGSSNDEGRARPWARRQLRPLGLACARPGRDLRRAPGRVPGRRRSRRPATARSAR